MSGIMGFLFLLSGVFVLLIIVGVVWSIKSGQFDDLETPAIRALHDDPPARGREDAPGGEAKDGRGGHEDEPALMRASFSPFTGRRCRQADEGRHYRSRL